MRKFHIPRGQSFFSSPTNQCYYCERNLNGAKSWTNLERTSDLFRPSTKSYGHKIKVIVCHTCQRSKTGLEPEEFLEHLQEALDNRQDYKNIDHSRIKTIVKNVNFILRNIEENLNKRNLTISRKSGIKKSILTYHSIQAPSRENKNTLMCFYCQKPLDNTLYDPSCKITRDHVRPKSKHPKSRLIVFSCPPCNGTKNNDEPEVFLAKLKIAYCQEQDFKKIPLCHLETIIMNLESLITKTLKPYPDYPALALVQHYDIRKLRQRIHDHQGASWLDELDDYTLLDLLLLCLTLQHKKSPEKLHSEARFLNIQNLEILLNLALQIGWVSAFYRIDTIDFLSITEIKQLNQYYILNDRGRAILQLDELFHSEHIANNSTALKPIDSANGK
ncbi:HNH endonuclease [Sphingobacterium sp. MYb388]|uniref:HNH endonuclease n=1 Tax=Sphingobacterium sp. MYb388 TaxID=2745437 RepID=UPI0030B65EEF